MGQIAPAAGRTWDAAASPGATRLARQYESAWRAAPADRRPKPDQFLPPDPSDRPGTLLALLRADLGLRYDAGLPLELDSYLGRYPELTDEVLVGLIYEEICLREESGQAIDPAEYFDRFPAVASQLRRVLDIHGLVGSGGTTMAHAASTPAIPFPEAGQTIAGFRLVEELGRGSFARVFLAEERQLADRPVALKVARTGSREPQTLARLQHTHIVPVHSYRTDPATDLHLLCMPYFGRVTLARLLTDPAARLARNGADLVAALDRLGPPEAVPVPDGRSTGRSALAQRSFPRAVAWWGARMAEALAHAHDRGVLHRDVKPSNVLVTPDGLPMLLDFNLAREHASLLELDDPEADAPDEPAKLGGTLDYMAPEHLEALADGVDDGVDARSDVYSLGVLLYEALAGARPFPPPAPARSISETLLRAAERRRLEAPSPRARRPDIPAALDAVVRRCLEPHPSDRYRSAAELAADLQAVADDAPLRFAREPMPARVAGWFRRHRRLMLTLLPALLMISAAIGAYAFQQRRLAEVRLEIEGIIARGKQMLDQDRLDGAISQFESAAKLAGPVPQLADLAQEARAKMKLADERSRIRGVADALFVRSGDLRYQLLDIEKGDHEAASRELFERLEPLYVLANPDWTRLPELTLLDAGRWPRLLDEVNELLFLWLLASGDPADPAAARRAVAVCDKALAFAPSAGPWRALRARYEAIGAGSVDPEVRADPRGETSASACVQWGLLHRQRRDLAGAIDWLERANRLRHGHPWYQYVLAYLHDQAGHAEPALEHYNLSVELDPEAPFARFNRARLHRQRRRWSPALEDLNFALAHARHPGLRRQCLLERGVVHQDMGDASAAARDYRAVIAADAGDHYGRAARLNRAKLDVDAGDLAGAGAAFDALLDEDPTDAAARWGRALLALRMDRPERAAADLDALVESGPGGTIPLAEILADRALARLALGRPREALADAERAVRLDVSPRRERIRDRAVLAARAGFPPRIDRPEEIAGLPLGGAARVADLRAALDPLAPAAEAGGPAGLQASLDRAVILAALADPAAATEVDQAVARAPYSTRAILIRARVLRHLGRAREALAEVERGLALVHEDPALLELRGALKVEAGRAEAGLADIDLALRRGSPPTIQAHRARALAALGRHDRAVAAWGLALRHDLENPDAYLGRARSFLALGDPTQALADLENAASWSGGRLDLLARTAWLYARCLDDRPDRLPRFLNLLARFGAAANHSARTLRAR